MEFKIQKECTYDYHNHKRRKQNYQSCSKFMED